MLTTQLVSLKKIIGYCLVLFSLLLFASQSDAQTSTDFSGTWTLDNAKSDAAFKDYKLIRSIVQTPAAITIEDTFFKKSGEKNASMANAYTLDGKETSQEKYGGLDKKHTKWSPDKKVLTITETRTVGKNVYGSNQILEMSDNGQVLTVTTTDVDPSNHTASIRVFNKQKQP